MKKEKKREKRKKKERKKRKKKRKKERKKWRPFHVCYLAIINKSIGYYLMPDQKS